MCGCRYDLTLGDPSDSIRTTNLSVGGADAAVRSWSRFEEGCTGVPQPQQLIDWVFGAASNCWRGWQLPGTKP